MRTQPYRLAPPGSVGIGPSIGEACQQQPGTLGAQHALRARRQEDARALRELLSVETERALRRADGKKAPFVADRELPVQPQLPKGEPRRLYRIADLRRRQRAVRCRERGGDMQLARPAVRADAPPVVEAVGRVGVLLYLCYEYALADSMVIIFSLLCFDQSIFYGQVIK